MFVSTIRFWFPIWNHYCYYNILTQLLTHGIWPKSTFKAAKTIQPEINIAFACFLPKWRKEKKARMYKRNKYFAEKKRKKPEKKCSNKNWIRDFRIEIKYDKSATVFKHFQFFDFCFFLGSSSLFLCFVFRLLNKIVFLPFSIVHYDYIMAPSIFHHCYWIIWCIDWKIRKENFSFLCFFHFVPFLDFFTFVLQMHTKSDKKTNRK